MNAPPLSQDTSAPSARRPAWLLFVHQLPSSESNLRVRVWRRLQQLGALARKQAVYVLPDSETAREDLQWLRQEVERAGGEADVFAASGLDLETEERLVREFRDMRQQSYAAIVEDAERARLAHDRWSRRKRGQAPDTARLLDGIRQRWLQQQRIDYFGSPGRDEAAQSIAALEDALGQGTPGARPSPRRLLDTASYRRRLWVTRPRPGVDRMSSAWLIRRFIDPDARFGFAETVDAAPEGSIPFDMFGGTFTHVGARCTFEELSDAFDLRDPAVVRIAAIVHDLDLKDGRFGIPDATVVGTLIEGLQRAHEDDAVLLEQGIALFDALYRGTGVADDRAPQRRGVRMARTAQPRSRSKAG